MVDFKTIDERTNLAGTNRVELLMFRLRSPVEGQYTPMYAINVFKVREIMVLPRLIDVPECHHYIAGVANIRGKAIPVIDPIRYGGYQDQGKGNILTVTEFNSKAQGFMVQEVDNTIQLAWSEILEPPDIVRHDNNNALMGMSHIEEDHMPLILDVERIIAEVLGSRIDLIDSVEMTRQNEGQMVFFVDDSQVAGARISRILDKMGIPHKFARNGLQALTALLALADEAESMGEPLSKTIRAIITDVEMPEMDGYVLTSRIRSYPRFNGIPVMILG